MLCTVVGKGQLQTGTYENYQYANRSLYVTYEVRGIEGQCAERFKVPDRICSLDDIRIGDIVDVQFNRFGRIDSIRKE